MVAPATDSDEGLAFSAASNHRPLFFADFACHERRLVIEVDGGQHNEMSRATADDRRTEFLHAHGYRMLRFWNNEVLGNVDGVMQIICAALRAPPPLTPPHRAMRGGRGTERS